jgi:hypothetical protein
MLGVLHDPVTGLVRGRSDEGVQTTVSGKVLEGHPRVVAGGQKGLPS